MSMVMKIAMLAGGRDAYWLASLYSATSDIGWKLTTDAAGNVYICGQHSSSAFVAKLDRSGAVQWQTDIPNGGAFGIALGADGSVYVGGEYVISSTDMLITKLSSAGAFVWTTRLALTSSTELARGICLDASGNIYVAGAHNAAVAVVKLNSSGTVQWQKEYVDGAANDGQSIVTDGTYCYVGGRVNSPYAMALLKIACSDGSISGQVKLSPAGGLQGSFFGACIDPTDTYVYAVGTIYGGPALLVKYNKSGVVQWQRKLKLSAGASDTDDCLGVAVDGAGNVYICGNTYAGGAYVAKYNSSGAYQWARTFSNVGTFRGITVRGRAVFLIGTISPGPHGSGNDLFIAKIPTDGLHKGTYSLGSFSTTYGDASPAPTDSAGDATAGTPSCSTSNMGGSIDAPFSSVTTPTLTQVKTAI